MFFDFLVDFQLHTDSDLWTERRVYYKLCSLSMFLVAWTTALTKYTPFKRLFDEILCETIRNVCVCVQCGMKRPNRKWKKSKFAVSDCISLWECGPVHVRVPVYVCIVFIELHIRSIVSFGCFGEMPTYLLSDIKQQQCFYLCCFHLARLVSANAYGNCLNFSDLLLQYVLWRCDARAHIFLQLTHRQTHAGNMP